jgi:hypothetical protein
MRQMTTAFVRTSYSLLIRVNSISSVVVLYGSPLLAGDLGAEMVVVEVALHCITTISSLRLTIPQDLQPADTRRSVLLQLQVNEHSQRQHGLHL